MPGHRSTGLLPLFAAEAKQPRKLTAQVEQITPVFVIGWSTDGSALFMRTGTDVPARVDRIDIKTGRRTLLKEIGPADLTGLATFDPLTVSRDGSQYAYRYRKILSTLFVVSR